MVIMVIKRLLSVHNKALTYQHCIFTSITPQYDPSNFSHVDCKGVFIQSRFSWGDEVMVIWKYKKKLAEPTPSPFLFTFTQYHNQSVISNCISIDFPASNYSKIKCSLPWRPRSHPERHQFYCDKCCESRHGCIFLIIFVLLRFHELYNWNHGW